MSGLLAYHEKDSVVHRLNPITKLVVSFLLCLSGFLSGSIVFVAFIIAFDILIATISGVGPRILRMLLGLAKLSIVLFLVQVLFVKDGNALITLPGGIYITDEAVRFSLLFVLRLISATIPMALMLSVTRVNDIGNALNRILGVPYKYAFALSAAIGFIPMFTGEMSEIVEAQTSRGVDMETRNIFRKVALILPLCAPLLISSVKKTQQASMSASLRGFSLRKRDASLKEYPFHARDFVTLILALGLTALAILT